MLLQSNEYHGEGCAGIRRGGRDLLKTVLESVTNVQRTNHLNPAGIAFFHDHLSDLSSFRLACYVLEMRKLNDRDSK